MLSESALKKKLRELGIPSTGSKPLLIRRHQEWLNIFNSNCDASDALRKSKRELLRELDEWERTQGGSANMKESHVMRKDFDGQGHATVHKSQFDDLIANARKRVKAATKPALESDTNDESNRHATQPTHDDQIPVAQTPHLTHDDQSTTTRTPQPPAAQSADTHAARPYEDNEAALSIIRRKVEEANRKDAIPQSVRHEMVDANERAAKEAQTDEDTTIGFQDPFGSPSRKMPMFALPADPVCDVDSSSVI
jgi:E3 ubiquitin-protein ligase RAD18